MTKNPTEGNNSSDNNSNSHGRDDRRGARPRTNSGEGKYKPREGGYDRDNRGSGDRPQGGYNRDNNRSGSGGGYNSDRPRYGQGQGGGYNRDNNRSGGQGGGYNRDNNRGDRPQGGYNRDNRSNSGGGYNSDRPRRDGGDFKPRQDYKPRENRDGQGSSYTPRDNRSSGRGDSPYPRRESVRPSEGGESGGYKPREGGYNRDNNRGDRPREGGYNRDNRGGDRPREGGYNRDNNRSGGYNRDNNRGGQGGGYNNRNRGGSDNRPRREGEAGDRRNPITNKIRSAYYNSYKSEEEGGGRGGSRDSFRQRDDRRGKKEHAPNYQLPADENPNGLSRLNKYIANSGICSRREADKLIEQGLISVNGKVISELGFKVNKSDEVRYEGKLIRPEKMVYVLLNKPKDFITTTEDPDERRTVMNLVSNACHERIYPVGRLDRNTTGLLLFTNDGDLAKRLTHPSHNISKIYQVELDRPLAPEDFDTIKTGFQLEDGKFRSDDLAYIDPSNRAVVGIEIHEGRNRLVRRVFEHFNYKVFKLDRVLYAGLTKKDLPRGNWRYLTEKEVLQLKFKNN